MPSPIYEEGQGTTQIYHRVGKLDYQTPRRLDFTIIRSSASCPAWIPAELLTA